MKREDIKIILVDIDKTLCQESCWTAEECLAATPVEHMINWVARQARKHYIILWTARKNHLMSATFEWIDKHNIKSDAVSNKKIAADIYIDDKMMHPEEL